MDHDFVDNHTEGYEGFAEFVKNFTLERGSKATGLSEDQILELLELIHNGKAVPSGGPWVSTRDMRQ